jgi:Thioesterase domain
MQRNPTLVQSAPSHRVNAVPLVLIHDGGGTTFSYHCLGSLQRTVYAISNPRFYSGRAWAGGIAAMARVYADLIRSVVPSRKVLLGGWFIDACHRHAYHSIRQLLLTEKNRLVPWRPRLS